MKIDSLKNTHEFNLVNKSGIKFSCPLFIMVYYKDFKDRAMEIYSKRAEAKPTFDYSHFIDRFKLSGVFLGFKASKKTGNAVKRNKIRRRIKGVFRDISKGDLRTSLEGAGIIFIPRSEIHDIEYLSLVNQISKSIRFFYNKYKQNNAIDKSSNN
jgi:ribonuclease P protein component